MIEQIDCRFNRVEKLLDARSDRLEARFDSLQRAMIIIRVSTLVAFIGLFASLRF